MDLELDFSLF
ncbi:hypothetical protein F383_28696 [Gossypium arboreum]|uniref:Uncharacterized protein n=1 Tax=Gossypium arboreum TaxID=29729 RepID=A0A0B0MX13_GOSAR|nr:hypothetical protein F383_28696 [Gossypium arboreum]